MRSRCGGWSGASLTVGCCRRATRRGPGGCELYRLLTSMGVSCDVVAPVADPKGTSDRVKTDLLTEPRDVTAAQKAE